MAGRQEQPVYSGSMRSTMRNTPCIHHMAQAFSLIALFLAASVLCSCWGEEPALRPGEWPENIKIVEIRGKTVRFPIPDGYEEMRREDHPDIYDWMVEVTGGDDMKALAFLIHSEDKSRLQRGEEVEIRHGFAYASDSFWDADMTGSIIWPYRAYFEKYIHDLCEGANEVALRKGENLYDWRYIYNGRKCISYFRIARNRLKDKDFWDFATKSFVVLDHKVVVVTLYAPAWARADVERLEKETEDYLRRMDRSRQ